MSHNFTPWVKKLLTNKRGTNFTLQNIPYCLDFKRNKFEITTIDRFSFAHLVKKLLTIKVSRTFDYIIKSYVYSIFYVLYACIIDENKLDSTGSQFSI